MTRSRKVNPKGIKLKPNKCVPKELIIDRIDDILYRIGLCLTSVREQSKRDLINHPLVVSIVISMYTTQRLVTLIIIERKFEVFKAL